MGRARRGGAIDRFLDDPGRDVISHQLVEEGRQGVVEPDLA
jgi:hypothetical protein